MGAQPSAKRVGRFRLIGRIARGGMAEIFLARPNDPDATDAGLELVVKRLHPTLRRDAEFLAMFRDEARLASRLDHPNVVRIIEVGEDRGDPDEPAGDGVPFIAMEHLRGVNLRELLVQLQATGRSLAPELGALIMAGALRGLEHAHGFRGDDGELLNIVHRDVSPQNVIVTFDGAIKLVDFGVAKAEGRLHHTRAGMIKGKFAYMSPEQVDGAELDGRSDLFALAEVIYELVLRRHPFYASTDMDVLRKILDEAPPSPHDLEPGFPDPFAQILLRAMEKKADARFPDARAMLDATSAWLAEQPRRATSGDLAALVRDLFEDRLEAEQSARAAGDELALVEAMSVGKPKSRKRAQAGGPDEERTLLAKPAPADPAQGPRTGRPSRPESVRVVPVEADAIRRGARIVPSSSQRPAPDPAERRDLAPPEPSPPPNRVPPIDENQPTPRLPPRHHGTVQGVARPETGISRLDLAIFVLGAVALLGAIGFALRSGRGSAKAHLDIQSDPPGASILLDGAARPEPTPARFELPARGSVEVEVRLPGGDVCVQTVQLSAGLHPVRCGASARP